MKRNPDRRFNENWEAFSDWVDHSTPRKALGLVSSVVDTLEEASLIADLPEIEPLGGKKIAKKRA